MKSGKPTRHILAFAQAAPGGVVRWGEILHIYTKEATGKYKSMFPKAVSRICKTHFAKVEGVRGFYVLKHLIVGDPTEEREHRAA